MGVDSVEPNQPSVRRPSEVDAWLDGIAGRDGEGADYQEGLMLRRALDASDPSMRLAELGSASVTWESIEAAAAARRPPVANDLYWALRAAATVAAVSVGLWLVLPATDVEPTYRGEGSAVASWVVPQAENRAQEMATELRALGAEVAVEMDGGAIIRLRITAPRAAYERVNRALTRLETALDAKGELVVEVREP